jgi:hypothetical protein
MMARLFHVSEEPGIARFEPRAVPAPDTGVTGYAVWAIDEAHLPNYLLPRDCPRVTYAVTGKTSADDIARFFGDTVARRVVVLEKSWFDRASRAVLYVYEMPQAPFHTIDASAGYYISRSTAAPLNAREVRDPLGEIANRGCEIRLVPDLWPVRDAVIASTLDFSIIRMRNAVRHA